VAACSRYRLPTGDFDVDFADILIAKYGSVRRGALTGQPSQQNLSAMSLSLASQQSSLTNGDNDNDNGNDSDSESHPSTATNATNGASSKGNNNRGPLLLDRANRKVRDAAAAAQGKSTKKLREAILALTTDPTGLEAEERMCDAYIADCTDRDRRDMMGHGDRAAKVHEYLI
jgi:hypothetical protein